jgi:hypothetical protein
MKKEVTGCQDMITATMPSISLHRLPATGFIFSDQINRILNKNDFGEIAEIKMNWHEDRFFD